MFSSLGIFPPPWLTLIHPFLSLDSLHFIQQVPIQRLWCLLGMSECKIYDSLGWDLWLHNMTQICLSFLSSNILPFHTSCAALLLILILIIVTTPACIYQVLTLPGPGPGDFHPLSFFISAVPWGSIAIILSLKKRKFDIRLVKGTCLKSNS